MDNNSSGGKTMLISHSKCFIFIHVIKTGGTSIKHALSCYDSHPSEQHATVANLYYDDIDYFGYEF